VLARTPVDWGLLVRERRRELGMSQSELSKLLGVTRQWVANFEKGASTAKFGLALQTVEAVGLRVSLEPKASDEADALDEIAPPPAW
jgi:HTH-type transcriptional regulator / antitoxin HipB